RLCPREAAGPRREPPRTAVRRWPRRPCERSVARSGPTSAQAAPRPFLRTDRSLEQVERFVDVPSSPQELGGVAIRLDQVPARPALLEHLDRLPAEVERSLRVARLGEDLRNEQIGAPAVERKRVVEVLDGAECQPSSLLAVAARGLEPRLIDAKVRDLDRRARARDDGVRLLERTRGVLDAAEIETDFRQYLLCVSQRVRVACDPQRLERLLRVRLGEGASALLEQQARLRPVETGARVRIGDRAAPVERLADDALGLAELAGIGQCVAQQRGEPDVLQYVAAVREPLGALAEERDRRCELADGRVRTPERLREPRSIGRAAVAERLLQKLDRLASPAQLEHGAPEPFERFGTRRPVPADFDDLAVERLGAPDLPEPQRDLGVDELRRDVGGADLAREIRLAHTETTGELAQDLERRNPVARLDPGDVRGRATRECELRLVETRLLTSRLQSPRQAGRIAHVQRWNAWQATPPLPVEM